MKAAVIGAGHIGLVTAARPERWGDDVIGMDDNASEIEAPEHFRVQWGELSVLMPERIEVLLGHPIVVDGRNELDPEAMRAAGIHYHSIGCQ